MVKTFRNNKDKSTVIVYEKEGKWFVKHCQKRHWLKRVRATGPFENEGDALLSCATTADFKFSEFAEVRS